MSEENEREILGPGDFVADCEIYGGALQDLVVPPDYDVRMSTGEVRFRPERGAVVPEVPLITRFVTTERGPSVYVEMECRVRGVDEVFAVPRSFITTDGRELARALGSVGACINALTAGPIALWLCHLEDANVDVIPVVQVDSRHLSVDRDGLVTFEEPEPEECDSCGSAAVGLRQADYCRYCQCDFSEGQGE